MDSSTNCIQDQAVDDKSYESILKSIPPIYRNGFNPPLWFYWNTVTSNLWGNYDKLWSLFSYVFHKHSYPVAGDTCPDAILLDYQTGSDKIEYYLKGNTTLYRMMEKLDAKPIVLYCGSFTCIPFRNKLQLIQAIANEFAEYCDFYIVYTAEVHTADGWIIGGDEISTAHKQPKTMKERLKIVEALQKFSPVSIPYLVDLIDNNFNEKYDNTPLRLFVLENKKFSYVGGPGPFKSTPEELRDYLIDRFKPSSI
ncbi:thyroxine 5'-deiodinase [Heterostelium album PN500]|uniref:Thyroxine 5'-deiodinase n=1 Tax=Heterostelium pallidum (strain ATCC 26659 / Pp 5 / PN500) TaxID=670386 RepID=D3BVN0_HETP5|nr:thyroxine 5'-deiodinase [Heterostelium album PN500]EFA74533.1 thyroxine 5'-deiodinase [Heterostelium album PN500]|eukprot:XP_020426667.1 thyroxine 5'-deiodinase [Heterostelium album PN500]